MIGEQIGNFRIASRLGQGGMGEVYLGEHTTIGTKVAIKMLLPHISAERAHVERFFNEAIAVGKIQHSGICKIFDVGFHDSGRAYLVMEFLGGESLAGRIRRLHTLPLVMVSDFGRQIAGVLEAVHKAGVTHRDLKPDNIFIVPDDELASGERVKILDFGIAKLSGAGGGLTATSAGSMGTPAYMSPEQWKNSKNVDWRADAYSLGCLAFEMAAGRPPFIAETIGEACSKHLTEEPVPLTSVVAVPPQLDRLVAQLLQKAPEARPPTMRDVANAFAGLVASANPLNLAATQLSGVAIPVAGGSTMPAGASGSAARFGQPVPSTPASSFPSMTPPPMTPSTTLGASAGSAQVAPTSSKKLMWILAGVGGALAITIVALVVALGSKDTETAAVAAGVQKPPPPPIEPAPTSSPGTAPSTPPPTAPTNSPGIAPSAPPNPPTPTASTPASSAPVPPASSRATVPPASPAKPTPPAEQAAPPVASKFGFLTVDARPFATISIDTRPVGQTPLVRLPLAPGVHAITAKFASGATKQLSVTIVADQTVKQRIEEPSEPAKVAETPAASQPPTTGGCDEVSCILSNHEGACCAKHKKPGARAKVPAADQPKGDLPEALDREGIASGVGPVKSRVMACGDKSSATGTVKISVKVNPDGSVASVSVKQTPDPALGACVAAALQRARFPKTQTGGTFGYPFVF